MATDRRTSEEFGQTVCRLTEGKSLRAISRQTGISHTYVDDMKWGVIPSYRVLVRFARGLELEPAELAELFHAAGYAPPTGDEPMDDLSGSEVFWQEFGRAHEALAAEGIYLHPPAHNEESPDYARMTPEQARAEVARLVELARADAARS